jgi:hypothetical protein
MKRQIEHEKMQNMLRNSPFGMVNDDFGYEQNYPAFGYPAQQSFQHQPSPEEIERLEQDRM